MSSWKSPSNNNNNNMNSSMSGFASSPMASAGGGHRSLNASFELELEQDDEQWVNRPACWSDDIMMNAYFSAFRSREINPLHFDNKLKFWKDLIYSYCIEKQVLQFDLGLLESRFRRKNVKPKCLDLVVSEMMRERTLLTREEALKPRASPVRGLVQSALHKLVWTPLTWSANLLRQTTTTTTTTTAPPLLLATSSSSPYLAGSSSLDQLSKTSSSPAFAKQDDLLSTGGGGGAHTFIVADLIESKSAELLRELQSRVICRNVDTLVEYEQVYELWTSSCAGGASYSSSDVDLLVKYLEANRKARVWHVATDASGGDASTTRPLLKFVPIGGGVDVGSLSEFELSYVRLREAERRLDAELAQLSEQVRAADVEIRAHLRHTDNSNNSSTSTSRQSMSTSKSAALKCLKRRKRVEKLLEDKEAVLANVQTMLASMQQADTNKLAYDVYSQSVAALREANKYLTLDKIDETMGDMQDALSANAEIEEALAKSPMGAGAANASAYDDVELNRELNELLLADHQQQQQQKQQQPLQPVSHVHGEQRDVRKSLKYDDDDNAATANANATTTEAASDSFDLSDILNSLPSVPVDELQKPLTNRNNNSSKQTTLTSLS